jgi:hypothetical protein
LTSGTASEPERLLSAASASGDRPQIGAGLGDDLGGFRRYQTGFGLGAGERALEVEHRPHERLGGERPGERLAREAAADDVQGRRSRARSR